MKLSLLFVILFLTHASWSYAEIYKRVDSSGHVTYSSEPIKGGKRLDLKPLPVTSAADSRRRSTPEDFPKVDAQTQKRRDNTRRIILEDELASEEIQLETAIQNLKALQDTPESLMGADGVAIRNTAKHADQMKHAQDQVTLHEQNIKALRTEISNLK